MRTKLIKLLVAITLMQAASVHAQSDRDTNSVTSMVTWDFPAGTSLEGLKAWAREYLTKPEFVEVRNSSTNILVILSRAGWGRPSTSVVHLYGLDPDDNLWLPRLVWNTQEEEIRVQRTKRDRDLIFRSKKGKTLMTLVLK
jgi:hypothetical protein